MVIRHEIAWKLARQLAESNLKRRLSKRPVDLPLGLVDEESRGRRIAWALVPTMRNLKWQKVKDAIQRRMTRDEGWRSPLAMFQENPSRWQDSEQVRLLLVSRCSDSVHWTR